MVARLETASVVDFFGYGRENVPPELQQLAENAYFETLEIFNSPSGQLGLLVLPAVRRLGYIYGEKPEDIFITRREDLLFEVNDAGVSCDLSELTEALSAIQGLCSSYYQYAEEKGRRLPKDRKRFDLSEVLDIAKTVVDRVVWEGMDCEINNPVGVAQELQKKVRGNLGKLHFTIQRIFSFSNGRVLSLDGELRSAKFTSDKPPLYSRLGKSDQYNIWGETIESQQPQNSSKDNGHSRETKFSSALGNLQMLARLFPLKDFTRYIALLDVREKIAVLTYLGYFGLHQRKGTTRKVQQRFGMERQTMELDLVRASQSLEELMAIYPADLSGQRKKRVTMWDIVREVEVARPVIRNGQDGRILRHDASRLALLEAVETKEFKALQLTDLEKVVVEMAMKIKQSHFVYTTDEIATKLGFKRRVAINRVFSRLLELVAMESSDRFVNQRGKVVKEGYAQHELILMATNGAKPIEFSVLSKRERRIFDAITTPDRHGRYPTREMALDNLGLTDRRIFSTVQARFKKKELLARLESLRDKVLLALEHGDLFSENELAILEATRTRLEAGQPLGGRSGGITYMGIAGDLNLSHMRVQKFIKGKLERETTRMKNDGIYR